MPRYGLATLFEELPIGYQITDEHIPLHLTHVDVFEVAKDAKDIETIISEALKGQTSFMVRVLGDKYIGPNKDILVSELELSPSLVELQNRLMTSLEGLSASFDNPQFLREGFAPHVTVHGERRYKEDDVLSIDHIVIGQSAKIVAKIPLSA